MSPDRIQTYHCVCTELVLATFAPLQNLPKRKGDGASVCKIATSDLPVPDAVLASGSTTDEDDPIILKLEDGFEKRFFVQCRRCDLKIGYRLDKSQFQETAGESGARQDVLYLLSGGLMTTEEMKNEKTWEKEIHLPADAAD